MRQLDMAERHAMEASAALGLDPADFFAGAERLARKAFGNTVELCAIINIRNGACDMDCHFCAQSKTASLQNAPQSMTPQELRALILHMADAPICHIGLVASGGAPQPGEFELLANTLEEIPQDIKSRLCVSLGRLSNKQLQRLQKTGIRRCHHNLETSREFYPSICSTQTWSSRADTIKRALDHGFEVCAGGIFGIGENWRDRLSLAQSLKEMGVMNIPINFLDPRPGSALADLTAPEPEEALACIAMFRHILPRATLRICGGRTISLRQRQAEAFRAGANALMTGDFLTTKGNAVRDDLLLLAENGFMPKTCR